MHRGGHAGRMVVLGWALILLHGRRHGWLEVVRRRLVLRILRSGGSDKTCVGLTGLRKPNQQSSADSYPPFHCRLQPPIHRKQLPSQDLGPGLQTQKPPALAQKELYRWYLQNLPFEPFRAGEQHVGTRLWHPMCGFTLLPCPA